MAKHAAVGAASAAAYARKPLRNVVEDLTRQAIAQNPEDFMAHIGFQAVDPQNDLPLWEETVSQRVCIGQTESNKFLIARKADWSRCVRR